MLPLSVTPISNHQQKEEDQLPQPCPTQLEEQQQINNNRNEEIPKTTAQWNIIMNDKNIIGHNNQSYKINQNTNTKKPTMTITAVVIHKQ